MNDHSKSRSWITPSAAFIMLIVFSPLLILIALLIKLTSKGPFFYISQRVGLEGVPFSIFKFRTMYDRPDSGPVITAPDDERITKIGRFLRNSKLDELPQIYNVLRGDMGFIGPRPEAPEIVDAFYTPEMRKTLTVRPGLTGAGTLIYLREFRQTVSEDDAVSSYANNILQRRLAADLDYMERRTTKNDVGLLWQTGLFLISRTFKSSNTE